jgi:hypothetical protein
MKVVTLRVRSRDAADLLGVVTWRDGGVTIETERPAFRAALQPWVDGGLVELVGEPPGQRTRETPATDPSFLERVAEYLQRTTGFITHLHEREIAPARPAVVVEIDAALKREIGLAAQQLAYATAGHKGRRANGLTMQEQEQRELAQYRQISRRLAS